jgi:hypothetical protein
MIKKDGRRRIYFDENVAVLYNTETEEVFLKFRGKKEVVVGYGVRGFIQIVKKLEKHRELGSHYILNRLVNEWSL